MSASLRAFITVGKEELFRRTPEVLTKKREEDASARPPLERCSFYTYYHITGNVL
jgi:hypothetical protein